MFRKLMLAGLMTATILGGGAPAYAQRGDREDRGGRNNGNWQQRADHGEGRGQDRQPGAQREQRQAREQPQQQRDVRVAQQPRSDGRQWRGEGRPAVAVAPAQRDVRQDRQDGRQDWRQGQRDVRQDWREDRRDDRRDGRQDNWRGRADNRGSNWNNNGNRNTGNWNNVRRYDDRTRWSSQQRWNNDWRQDRRYDWQSYRNRYGDRYRAGRYYAPRGWSYGYRQMSVGIFLSSLLYSNNYWLDDPYSYRLPPAYGSLRWVRYYDDAMLVDVRDGYVVDVIRDFFW